MKKSVDEPHAMDKCNAKTRAGGKCKSKPMPNGRCRMHGGKSTGPITEEGLRRSRTANLKHGKYSKEAKQLKSMFKDFLKSLQGS